MLYRSNLGNPGEDKSTEEVNMVPCEDFSQDLYDNYFLCPDWSDEHVLFTNYNYDETAYLRLAVLKCDPEERAYLNKTCKSDEEINEYFATNVFSVKAQQEHPDLESKNIDEFSRKS
jgi:hypothetical protein